MTGITLAPLDAGGLRQLMGCWATGVSVLTSRLGDAPRGCTANAVTSVSLDPLLLLACFDLGSSTLEAVRASRRFAVNMLAHDQEHVSRRFARKDGAKFAGVAHRDVEGAPVVDGALAWIVCAVQRELDGGDHAIVLGRPLAGGAREGAGPLVYFRSRYGGLGAAPAVPGDPTAEARP
jgi:3-hydroxy-9,10-secoandrosta-1,3,5(10)-triene-9,17-dione monooxygenase reductase component